MPKFEYQIKYKPKDYRIRIDKDKYEAIVVDHQSEKHPIDKLTLQLVDNAILYDGIAIRIKKDSRIRIPLEPRLKEIEKDIESGQHRLDFILLHELKHVIDLKNPLYRSLRAAYWIGIPWLTYVSMSKFTNHVSPGDPLNSSLSFAWAIGSYYPLYHFDPFERRANKFAEEILADESNRELITFKPIE